MIDVLWARPTNADRSDSSRLARVMLAELGVPHVEQECADCGGPHGQPVAETGFVSIAHTPGAVVVATASRPVGIDVEAAGGDPLWTRTEAVLKADGRGLRVDPDDVHWRGARAQIESRGIHYRVVDVPVDAAFQISVAIAEERFDTAIFRTNRRAVRVREWPLEP